MAETEKTGEPRRSLYGTWRVVTPRGRIAKVEVFRECCECGCKQTPTWVKVEGDSTTYGVDRNGEANERAIRAKIAEAVACSEILAPGVLTRAEEIAAARADALRDALSACGAISEEQEAAGHPAIARGADKCIDAIAALAASEAR